jgi:hypothetical protein
MDSFVTYYVYNPICIKHPTFFNCDFFNNLIDLRIITHSG